MFDALINGRLDNQDYEFELLMADIEELNQAVENRVPDISKISYAAFPEASDHYEFLSSGSALGYRNGPLIVSKHKIYPDELSDATLGIPGIRTTANFLAGILFPGIIKKKVYLFSDIEEAVLSNEVDAGLLIHESRFTYFKKGLKLVADLGDLWERHFQSPIPLGGIVVKRSLPDKFKSGINKLINESVLYALKNPQASEEFVKSHARETEDEVIRKHIDLYVNDFSIELGDEGKKAVHLFCQKGEEHGLFQLKNKNIFYEPIYKK